MTNPTVSQLVCYWTMDEFTGTRQDKRGNVPLYEHILNDIPANLGKRGRAVDLHSGGSDYLYSGDNFFINMGGNIDFSIGLWIYPHNIAGNGRILAKWTYGNPLNSEYQIYISGSQIKFDVNDGTTNYGVTATNFGNISNYKWYFVGCYYDSYYNTIGVCVNDVWNATTGPTTGIANKTNDFQIGRSNGGPYYDGLVDELGIWRQRLLTPAEWTWLYNNGYGRSYFDIAQISPPIIPIDTKLIVDPLPVEILDQNFKVVGIIEDYYSLVWAERNAEVGDFEWEVPIKYQNDPILSFGNFLRIKTSDRWMIIEDIKPIFEEEKEKLLIKGESIESILKRRTFAATKIDGLAELSIYRVVLEHLIQPTVAEREISIFSQDYFQILSSATYEEVYEEGVLYDFVKNICSDTGLGFRVLFYNGEFIFFVYNGVNYSKSQTSKPWIIFSEQFDNVISSSFYSSEKNKINIVLVLTDDIVYPAVWVWDGVEPSDLNRREAVLETTVDRDVVSPALTDSEVLAIINTRGKEVINSSSSGYFEGDFDVRGAYVLGEDFLLGDVVQCELAGMDVEARIIEVVRSYSGQERKTYVAMDFLI